MMVDSTSCAHLITARYSPGWFPNTGVVTNASPVWAPPRAPYRYSETLRPDGVQLEIEKGRA